MWRFLSVNWPGWCLKHFWVRIVLVSICLKSPVAYSINLLSLLLTNKELLYNFIISCLSFALSHKVHSFHLVIIIFLFPFYCLSCIDFEPSRILKKFCVSDHMLLKQKWPTRDENQFWLTNFILLLNIF